MGKVDKSTGASFGFSAKAIELSKKSQTTAAPFKGPQPPAPPAKAAHPAPAPAAPAPASISWLLDLGEGISVSSKARELAAAQPPVATTVDAGAPKGSSKRISAYGEAQRALAPKGGGFEGSA